MGHPHAPAILINGFSVSMPLCANSNLLKSTWFPDVFLSSSKALYSSWNLSGIFFVALTIDEPGRVEAERLIVDLGVEAGPLEESWRICEHDGQKNSRLARSGVLWMRETWYFPGIGVDAQVSCGLSVMSFSISSRRVVDAAKTSLCLSDTGTVKYQCD